ncbi:alpha-glucosidase [Lacibacter luteus]|uniref:Alpha-glucosidase n=2 Tax=Lacibacter luteus TaxID=2508719 RepID=A0A4Q1CKU7_9BACT|nr:alpha-glucosidase [Lacibacter luteus]
MQNKTWWKEAVVYQIYPRSFKDSDGDGIGDIKGIISKLDYIQSLGIDAVWLNPIYESPNKDNGYDISDYRNVSKQFGSMNDFDTLLAGFHQRGIKVFMDLVVNHCSNEHPWFKEASKSRNSPYYNYFHWWPAEKGEPPYRFSIFDEKGYGWEFNKATNSYYLHYFGDFQPDLNWENPKLRQEVYDIMKFWSKKGIDGFRMDALAFIAKDTTWPALPPEYNGVWVMYYASGPHLHDYIQEMNKEVLTPYKLATVAEAMGDVPRVKKFVDEDRNELNMAYNFEAIDFGYLPNEYKMPDPQGWDLVKWKQIYKRWDSAFTEKGWGTVYLANHDQPRMVTRWGNDAPEFRELSSKMLSTFILTMRGTAFYYFGDEIGMNNIKFDKVEDYNDVELHTNYAQVKAKGGDLKRFLEGMKISSRDNGRTPMQWDSTSGAGFTLGNPWLKINPNYTTVNVAAAEANQNSALHYFRKLTTLRKANEALQYGAFTLVDADNPDVFAYTRTLNNKTFLILLNFKNKTATLKTGMDLSKGKTLLNNYGSTNASETLQPYEASVIEF